MEELNKNQLILLVLFVTFVTSIATGIVTVSLMEQAPQSVTQTINRVVTQTIEKVTPAQTATIIKSDSDLIAEAAEKNAGLAGAVLLGDGGEAVGQAFPVSDDGYLASNVNPAAYAEEAKYYFLKGGISSELQFIKFVPAGGAGFSLFRVAPSGEGKKAVYPPAPAFADADALRLGQGILALTAEDTLLSGLVSSITRDAPTASTTPASADAKKQPVVAFKTNIPSAKDNSGMPIFTLGGAVIGIFLVQDGSQIDIPISVLRAAIPKAETRR